MICDKENAMKTMLYGVMVVMIAGLLGACGLFSPFQGEQSASDDVLFSVLTEGGLCIAGQCQTILTVARDGDYTLTSSTTAVSTGTITAGQLAILTERIATTDYAAIRAKPFTDVCPIAYDGSVSTYTFYTSAGVESLASCEVVIDPTHPLFSEINALMMSLTSG
jgi:hypothetical protein